MQGTQSLLSPVKNDKQYILCKFNEQTIFVYLDLIDHCGSNTSGYIYMCKLKEEIKKMLASFKLTLEKVLPLPF